ncbi:MAG: 4-hydroxy-tetrahydrodipicolinate synthase [Limnochordaceae bacterium]|nr:4-hydroxy-tetrahydrodipicolinate synthase [Limnochordaceae bacterium]
MQPQFGRILTAMVTPFDKDLNVDYARAADLAVHLVETGSDGVVVSGSTGESPTLTREEKIRLFGAVVEAVGGRAVVLAGTGTNSTRDSIELSKAAEAAGVDGLLLVVPYYNKPPQDALYEHFRAVAESVHVPIMLYNVPGRTGTNLAPETVARLAQVPNIVALKEAFGQMDQVSQLRRLVPPDFAIYSGDDSLTLPMLSLGAVGVVSVAAHLVGRRLREMIDQFLAGKVEAAARIHLELFPLFRALFVTSNPIPVKQMLRLVGQDVGSVRPPLGNPTPAEVDMMRQTLKQLGLI